MTLVYYWSRLERFGLLLSRCALCIFKPDKEADSILIDPDITTYLKYRREKVHDICELLFILMALGSEGNIKATIHYG